MKNIKHTYENNTGIYCILNLFNSKIYIGSSKHIYYRLREHLHKLRKNTHHTDHLQRSFNKNGEDNFYSFVVELCNEEELIEKEEYWMNLLKADYNKVFKDLKRPACSYSQETKDRISKAVKQRHANGELSCGRISIHTYNLKGRYLESYTSILECTVDTKTSRNSIRRVLIGENKQANGFQFSLDKVKKVSPVVYEKRLAKHQFKLTTVLDTVNNIESKFDSCIYAANFLNTTWNCLKYYSNKENLYKKRYRISVAT